MEEPNQVIIALNSGEVKRSSLTLKAPITTAADDIHKYFYCFSEKISLDVSSESSARQRIHLNIKPYFLNDKSKEIKCRLLQFLFGALRVKFSKSVMPWKSVHPISTENTIKARNVHLIHIQIFLLFLMELKSE